MAYPRVVIPHVQFPLTLDATGNFATVEQDTDDEIAQCVAVLVTTRRGERVELDQYGVPDPTFRSGLVGSDVEPAVRRWEPRALAQTEERIDSIDELARSLVVKVQAAR